MANVVVLVDVRICPSGLRSRVKVAVFSNAWVQIPQYVITLLSCFASRSGMYKSPTVRTHKMSFVHACWGVQGNSTFIFNKNNSRKQLIENKSQPHTISETLFQLHCSEIDIQDNYVNTGK